MWRITAIFLVVFLSCNISNAQTEDIPQGYAIVVGAYAKSKVDYAVKFTKYVSDKGYKARFGLNQRRSLIYVYVDHTASFKEALVKMRDMREKDGFEDTWVHVKTNTARLKLTPEQEAKAAKATNALKKEVVNPLGDLYAERFKDKNDEEDKDSKNEPNGGVKTKDSTPEEINETIAEQVAVEDNIEESVLKDDRLNVWFRLINSSNNKEVLGEVQVIDTERSKLMDVVESGEHAPVNDPKNGSGQITLIADVFGYRKLQKEFNYYEPYAGPTNAHIDSTENGPVITFDLVRYRVGDIAVMYNVFFFKDAAIMRPESQYEVNNLLTMLQENENMKIRIHGHVNGRNAGTIVSREGDNFYALPNDVKKGFGSAKELSKQRAETIRELLISKGIAAERMEIKAWGGKRMLHDKLSTKAKENVRVEIEILEE